ncbi:MAG TPA: serine/threonine-protein kinase [Actinomycetota bacterium]|nr:serine/threonine-protein kinase [Actinomycetota bacterium]
MSKEDVSARQVSGRYSLTEPLGRGGMGTVWAADDTLLKRRVAVKEVKLPPSIPLAERDAIKARATREARAAAQLSHPNVVTIFDVIEDDGTYIVMELVGAPTLAETVRESGPLNYRQAARIGLDVLDALEAAHAKGIIHRDVKPGNVMCPPGGRAKLADFGIASLKGDPKITTTGMIMGSPSFMAPEQATGQATGPATDLWSLGATLYFATEGVPPFDRGQPIPTLTAVVHDDAPSPQGAGALGPVIAALMSKESEDRPDPAELRPMLVDVAEGRQADVSTEVYAPPVEREEEATPRPAPAPGPETPPTPHEVPDRRGRGALVALGLAVLLVVGGLVFWGLQDDDPPAETPQAEENGGRNRGQGGGGGEPEEEPDIGPTRTFVAGDTGYGVEVPEGWQERPQAETRIDLVDPETGDYLRVEWTDQPGEDALAAWETQASSFAASHENYQELRLEDDQFQDSPTAALWEYTWSEGDAQLHAHNLGFVTGDGEYGFALNFVTDEDNWDESQPLWENFTATFGPS